jgi:hypothetical protein
MKKGGHRAVAALLVFSRFDLQKRRLGKPRAANKRA